MRIAVAGKGGVGKTSLASLMTLILSERSPPVLAIDADANSNLGEKLGLSSGTDMAAAMEGLRRGPEGVPKQDLLRQRARQALSEGEGHDLLAMGRPHGEGCYCFANTVLKEAIGEMSESYRHVVVDNEAGMEHLSRRTVEGVDLLALVSDPSPVAMRSAARIRDIADEVGIGARRVTLLINLCRPEDEGSARRRAEEAGFQSYSFIPYDPKLDGLNMEGRPLRGLEGSEAYAAMERFCERLILPGS